MAASAGTSRMAARFANSPAARFAPSSVMKRAIAAGPIAVTTNGAAAHAATSPPRGMTPAVFP